MALIAPSILSANFANLQKDIEAVLKAGAQVLHIDVMDGMFVPNITIGIPVVKALRSSFPDLTLDVHLMIVEPERYIESFCRAGADWISVHVESTPHAHRALSMIKEFGKKAGLALNPSTPLCFLEELSELLDFVLIMSVNPGFGGQKFIKASLSKVRRASEILKSAQTGAFVEVDGGINPSNAAEVVRAGASVLVAGSAVFKGNPEKNFKLLKEAVETVP